MDPKVKRKAEELGDALAASEAYTQLQEARKELEGHEAAKIMLRDLQLKEMKLQEKLGRGEQPTEAEIVDYQRTAELVSMNPYVRKLIEAQVAFSQMWTEVQQELARAVGLEVPEAEGEIEGGEGGQQLGAQPPPTQQAPSGQQQSARSKLWVPGRG